MAGFFIYAIHKLLISNSKHKPSAPIEALWRISAPQVKEHAMPTQQKQDWLALALMMALTSHCRWSIRFSRPKQ